MSARSWFCLALLASTFLSTSSKAQPADEPATQLEEAAVQTAPSEQDARQAVNDQLETGKAQAEAAAEETARAATQELAQEVSAVKDQAKARLTDALGVLESDNFQFGIFPNTAGFMDARLHVRHRYLRYFSSGVYLDYTTARSTSKNGTESRSDRVVREYRAEADAVKGVWVVAAPRGDRGVGLSLEPGANGKVVYQDITQTGFTNNSFDETLFESTTTQYFSLVSSARLESSLVVLTQSRAMRRLSLDLSGEWLPFIYSRQKDSVVTSQFDSPVKSTITNYTSGYQAGAILGLETERAGRYRVRAGYYDNRGKVSGSSRFAAGNFEYRFDTFTDASRQDLWIELTHSLTYLKILGGLVPAVGVAYQRKVFESADDRLETDVYKLALLLENQ